MDTGVKELRESIRKWREYRDREDRIERARNIVRLVEYMKVKEGE